MCSKLLFFISKATLTRVLTLNMVKNYQQKTNNIKRNDVGKRTNAHRQLLTNTVRQARNAIQLENKKDPPQGGGETPKPQ